MKHLTKLPSRQEIRERCRWQAKAARKVGVEIDVDDVVGFVTSVAGKNRHVIITLGLANLVDVADWEQQFPTLDGFKEFIGTKWAEKVENVMLSREDFTLIPRGLMQVAQFDRMIVNHFFYDGYWHVLHNPIPFEDKCCSWCFSKEAIDKCGRCLAVRYCSKDCQKIHWPEHKLTCGKGK